MLPLMVQIYSAHEPYARAQLNAQALETLIQPIFADMLDPSKRRRTDLQNAYAELTDPEFIACSLNRA